jgi:iron complex transport system substrate-binding protein
METKEAAPKRIISLLGAASETLFRLGVGDRLVGRSHECDYPPALLSLPCISRPRLDVDASSLEIDQAVRDLSASGEPVYELTDSKIAELQPVDLLIAQDHCRVCAVTPENIAQSSSYCSNIPQLVLRPATLQDCLDDVVKIAKAVGVPERGARLKRTMEMRIERVKELVRDIQPTNKESTTTATTPPRVALLEWCNPIMGCGYWLPEMVEIAGGTPLHCPPPGGATPSITLDALLASKPDVVIFALCGFGTSRAAKEIADSWSTEQLDQLRGVCKGNIFVVDGNYLINRSGPRVVESCEALAEAIHPDLQGHFNHYGTDHLATLDAAMEMAKAGIQTGSLKVRPKASIEETLSESAPPQPVQLPKDSPTNAVIAQLKCLRTNDMATAFALNSVGNQNRWCDAGRFKHVMKSHDTFCRLLSEETTVRDEAIQNGIATAVVCLPEKDGKVSEMVWTMVSEISPKHKDAVWRTEKVALV